MNMYEILTDRLVLGVSGQDAMKFLHNITTNDIKRHSYSYNYILSSQGRYLFDCFIFKISEVEFLIDINRNVVETFISHLLRYKLRAKIEIRDFSDNFAVIYSRISLVSPDILFCTQDPRNKLLGFRSVTSNKEGFYSNSFINLYTNDKYYLSIIDGFIDLIYDKSIISEYGAEELNAVSYNKGCYIGQEVISRLKYQGTVRKKIFKVSADVSLSSTERGTEILADDRKIGHICSTYGNIGIALVRIEEYSALKHTNIILNNGINIMLSVPNWR